MLIKKEIFIDKKKAVLSYDDTMFNKDANELKYGSYVDVEILFVDYQIKVALLINGEEFYDAEKSENKGDFYFEVVDVDDFDNELACSDAIYEAISDEKELIRLLTKSSYFINNMDEFKRCPSGYVLGHCTEEASAKCEFSASTVEGLCGAECQDCFGEMFASKEDGAYICECSKIFFEDRHHGFRGLE